MRWTGELRLRRPRLSVVVPVHDVAPYLADCLDSILAQPVTGLQVVVVDDGSTDGSAEIAAAYARRDRRVELVVQANAGVSVARHAGIQRCRGRFLAFVDPDDVLPGDAWSTMLRTLAKTGSDFVVGAAERTSGDRRFMTPLMERNHREQRLRITIDDQPLMLADVFVWNKIFRRRFWRDADIQFPVGTRYQDQPALTQAFLAARSFDVLTEVVYDWAVRPSGGSATQRRRDLDNLRDRVETKRMTVAMVVRHGNPELERVLRAEILPIDMWEHFRAVPGAGDDYWQLLRDAVVEFWAPPGVTFDQTTVPVQQRLMGWLVATNRREDLATLIDFLDASPNGPPIVDGELRHPWYGDPSMPEGVTRARPAYAPGSLSR